MLSTIDNQSFPEPLGLIRDSTTVRMDEWSSCSSIGQALEFECDPVN
jgi:hypothetical protein